MVTVAYLYIYKGLERLMHVFFVLCCVFLHFLYFAMIDAIAPTVYRTYPKGFTNVCGIH